MKNIICLLILLVISGAVVAQKKVNFEKPNFTSSEARLKNKATRKKMIDKSLVKNVKFESIGPTIMSGRVTDLEVDPSDPTHFYVAYASGGLWETKNNGASFVPLFDDEVAMTIGDIAVNWRTNTIYVGTGEKNSSRSSYAGVGIFKSSNNGESWTHIGLAASHHISRIVLHPTNDRIIWVAALGNLYSSNPERGVFKSNNGGQTWGKTFYLNDQTGAVDLMIDPSNSDRLFVAMWQRERSAWNFSGSGENSGIFRSEDGGQQWLPITGNASGFPKTKGTGRIGLAISLSNPNVLYALLDNQDRRSKEDEFSDDLVSAELKTMDVATFLALDDSLLSDYLKDHNFPGKYDVVEVKRLVEAKKVKPSAVAIYHESANTKLFDTPVKGAELYRSNDGGSTWEKTHEAPIDNMYYSYGYYFGEVRVDAQDPDKVYALGVPLIRSDDGGATWQNILGDNQHGDLQSLWVDPSRTGHLISGSDGGVNISYDDGDHWVKCNSNAVGQFYDVNYDMAEPYNIYGGLQDNGVWVGASQSEVSSSWHSTGAHPWKLLQWGDGMQTEIDTRDNNIIYTGYQYGNYYRINQETGDRKEITPMHELGKKPFRWNWETPIHLSKHNQDIIYMGSNRFHRSMNQGDDFETTSKDLTKGGRKGNVSYGTMTVIAESPMKFGLIYIGTDDGVVQLSTDGGSQWTLIDPNLTKNYWVSSIEPSRYKEGRVYLTLNGYRWDDFRALIYVSENYGKTWRQLGLNLPTEAVNVIVEDPVNENLLYVGTDHGAYVSLDRGVSFTLFQGGLPNVAVHDLVVHPRENDLIVGTHGRSIYVADMAPIQMMMEVSKKEILKIWSVGDVKYDKRWGEMYFREVSDEKITITYFSRVTSEGVMRIYEEDRLVYEQVLSASKGLNFVTYDLSRNGEAAEDGTAHAENGKVYLLPADYRLEVSIGSTQKNISFKIE